MSSALEAVRLRSTRLGVAVSTDALALTALGAFAAGLVALTWGAWGDLNNDTGYDFVAGSRFAHGELPYVDYVYYYGPLAPALLGAASVLGGGVAPFVAIGLLLAGGIVLASYTLARMHTGPLGAFLAGAITAPVAFAPSQFSFVLPHAYDATLGILCLLCVLLELSRFTVTGRSSSLAAAGIAAGLAALTKPEFALAGLAALCAWLAARRVAGRGSLRETALVVGPAALIPAAVYGAFLTAVSLHRLVFDNLDRTFMNAAGTTMLKARTPLTVSSFAQLGLKLALYAGGAAALYLLARAFQRSERFRRPAFVALLLGAMLVVAASVASPERLRHGLQFAYGWIPAGAALALLLFVWRRRARAGEWRSPAPAELAGLVALTVLAATTYAVFYPYAWRPQMAAYAVPLAAVFLARLHLVELGRLRGAYVLGALWLAFLAAAGAGLTLKDAGAESATVRGPGGSLRTTPAQAAAYQAALSWITTRTKPGDPVLIAPQVTWLYTLSGRHNPLPEVSLLPGALTDVGAERAAIRRLESADVRLAMIDRRTFSGYGQTFFGGSFDRVLARWVERHFVRAATLQSRGGPEAPALQIWTREGS